MRRPLPIELPALLAEYNLIVDKKSNLSRAKRDEIVAEVRKLIKQGKVKPRV